MCAEPLGDGHSHVVNLDSRQILCTCRACYLLFTHQGAAGGRYRAVPDRYLRDLGFRLDEDAGWDALQIPVCGPPSSSLPTPTPAGWPAST